MSVTKCELLPDGATVSVQNQQRTYKKKYQITVNQLNEDPLVVLLGAQGTGPDPLPDDLDIYSFSSGTDQTVFVTKIDVKPRLSDQEPSLYWDAEVEWGPLPGFSSGGPPNSNPLLDPVRFRVEDEKYTRSYHTDQTGTAIVNSLGLNFDPPIQANSSRPVLVAVRNMYPLQAVVDLMLEYRNSINSAPFYGAPAHMAKVDSIQMGDLSERNQIPYFPVTIRIEFADLGSGTGTSNPDASWDIRVANTSWVHKYFDPFKGQDVIIAAQEMELIPPLTVPSSNPLDYQIKAPGIKLSAPVNIRISDGFRLFPDGALPEFVGPFQVHPEKNFAGLGIGGS